MGKITKPKPGIPEKPTPEKDPSLAPEKGKKPPVKRR